MYSLNKVIIIGALGRDPEIRSTQAGSQIANLSVATSQSWKDKNGEWQERTEWNRVVVWNQHLMDRIKKMSKGSRVYVEGTLQTRKWTDNSGSEKFTTEIVVPRFGGDLSLLETETARKEAQPEKVGTFHSVGASAEKAFDLNDDIPW